MQHSGPLVNIYIFHGAKRIRFFLKADSGFWAVSGIYFDRIGEREEFGMYAVDQLCVIASRQIGAADAVVEQYIAPDNDTVLLIVERYMTR